MTIKEIKKVCVIGAGTMGLQISLVAAVHGYKVTVYDVAKETIQKAPERHRGMIGVMKLGDDANRVSDEKALALLSYTTNAAAAAKGADIISESVPEQLALKKSVHAQFEKLCKPKAILTTNTSTLLVSDIEPVLARPERFLAMHFHSGLSPLVDIMKGTKASDETIDVVKKFVQSIGLVPQVMKKEWGGYVFNTMLGMWFVGGLITVANGVATPEEVDRAWMLVTGQQIGPFGSMDSVGLDVIYEAGNEAAQGVSPFTVFSNFSEVFKPYIDRGELGMKTGKGFYTYPNPAYIQPGFLKGE
jgi:3-hydroxybutyryl-CoA dehydrogenase